MTQTSTEDIEHALAAFAFPTALEQAGSRWLGDQGRAGVAAHLRETAELLRRESSLQVEIPEYENFIDNRFVEAAAAKVPLR